MADEHSAVFFFDCDNTLLDNDRFRADLDAHLAREFGADGQARYWRQYDELRDSLGYADYLGAVQRLRLDRQDDPRTLTLSQFLLDYPFDALLYPGALDAVEHCRRRGIPVVLSDGDAVFQPHKLRRSGLWRVFEERVLVYVHKERMLDAALATYPAAHYVMVDDKLTLLTAMKRQLESRLVTVWPRQGHYAAEALERHDLPAPDLALDRIAELAGIDLASLL